MNKKHSAGIRKKLVLALSLFTLFVILVLWVFQIVFLDSFYQMIMTGKLESAADHIVAASLKENNDGITAKVYELAEKTGFCVSVYRIKGSTGERTVSAHVSNSCVVHNLRSENQLNELYSSAVDSGGKHIRYYSFGGGTGEGSEASSVIFSRTFESADGVLMILVNSNVAPVEATISTLQVQLGIITVILSVAAAIIAFFVSRALARPVTVINEEAKILATGSYNVDFTARGYREVEELAQTLNYAAVELSKVDRMQKELIANISHDLRTPLTMISGYSQVMRDIPGEMTAENMQIIIDETGRLTSLVNDILDLSRLTSGGMEMKNEPFSLTELVRESMERYAHLKEREGYRITFHADTEAVVCADSTRISQVLYNLVNNAISYTGEDKSVTVTQTVEGDEVCISVADTGDGIPEDQLELIWERYYKASEYHRRGIVGSGLGLSIVKGILESYGAPFGVSSRVGEGCVFWFRLPLWKGGGNE